MINLRRLGRTSSGRLSRHHSRGQSLVEFAFILPLFMILLMGLMEFGFLFAHHQGIEYATREGARTGSGLSNGQADQNGYPGGGAGGSCHTIDNQIIAAVQRMITGKGSLVDITGITQIRIFKADDSGNAISPNINVWTPGAGPVVDGIALKFKWTSGAWDACTRNNGATPDSLGVDIAYTYKLVTPLGALLKWANASTLQVSDKTVMVLNP